MQDMLCNDCIYSRNLLNIKHIASYVRVARNTYNYKLKTQFQTEFYGIKEPTIFIIQVFYCS